MEFPNTHNKMDLFLTLLYQRLYGSIIPWVEYSQNPFAFTTFSCSISWLQKNVKSSNASDLSLERLFLTSYLYSWLRWHQKQRCRTSMMELGYKKKYKLFWDQYHENPFYGEKTKQQILHEFMKIQKTYMAFKRFAYLWKYKRAPMTVTTDLYFTDIDLQKDSTFILYQNNAKFSFKMSELLRVIETAVCHHFEDNFEIEHQRPKNPYNKIVIEKHNLYNIYHHILLQTKMSMPIFYRLWFKQNFDLRSFCRKNDLLLKEICVKNYVATLNVNSFRVYEDVKTMISENRNTIKWWIHPNFPKEEVVKKVRSCLYEYYMMNLLISIPEDAYSSYEKELYRKLTTIYFKDRSFGMIKIVQPTSKKIETFSKTKFVFDPTQKVDSTFKFGSLIIDSSGCDTSRVVNARRKRRKNTMKYSNTSNKNSKKSTIKPPFIHNMFSAMMSDDLIPGRDDEDMRELHHLRTNGMMTVNDTLNEELITSMRLTDINQMFETAVDAFMRLSDVRRVIPHQVTQRRRLHRETLENREDILPSISNLFSG
jgi:hypothetical protein